MENLQHEIDKIISEVCAIDDFKPSNKLRNDLEIDSLALTNLVIELEENFNFEFEMDDLDPKNLNCIEDLYRIVEKYVGAD